MQLLPLSSFLNKFFYPLLSDDMFFMSEGFENNTKYDPCNCIPECSNIFYRTETSQIDIQKRKPGVLSPVTFL